jgi:carbon monoxide dehydrogenase subunit G
MGIEKYVSDVKMINYPVEKVYEKLSNLENLNKLMDPEKLKEIREKVPNAPDLKLDNFQATKDECSFSINPIGKVGFQIVEREINKTIKLQGSETLPLKVNLWIQLLSVEQDSCKIRLTVHADMNPMIKMMVNKHLKEGVDKIAEAMTKIPFD